MKPLDGIQVLSLAVNLPGPLAVARLVEQGAMAIKVEPPTGDALARVCPAWYADLHANVTVHTLDLKTDQGRRRVEELLTDADLLLTATRPSALQRLGLDWPTLHASHPQLCQIGIVGYPTPHDDIPGHDLTYLAQVGLLEPPRLPRTCLADLAGAQRAVAEAMALLLKRERSGEAGFTQVSLADAAREFAAPWRFGLTTPAGLLGGGDPGYDVYPTRDGWLAVAALEPHFRARLAVELGLADLNREQLRSAFLNRTAAEWEAWAVGRDLPMVRVRE